MQSRSLLQPLQPEGAPGPSSRQAAAQLGSTPDGLDHQQQLSGNPFASDSRAAGTGSGNGLLASSSSLAHIGSGNPFRHTAEADATGVGQDATGVVQGGGQNRQAAIPIAWDQGGSPTAPSDVMKTAEMSPLQNGLIRLVQSSSLSGLARYI